MQGRFTCALKVHTGVGAGGALRVPVGVVEPFTVSPQPLTLRHKSCSERKQFSCRKSRSWFGPDVDLMQHFMSSDLQVEASQPQ